MTAPEHIDVGDLRRLSVTNITDAAGVPTSPTTLVLKVLKPLATTVTTYTRGTDAIIVEDTPYDYHADIPLDTPGIWKYDWQGSGAATFSEGGGFYVRPQQTA